MRMIVTIVENERTKDIEVEVADNSTNPVEEAKQKVLNSKYSKSDWNFEILQVTDIMSTAYGDLLDNMQNGEEYPDALSSTKEKFNLDTEQSRELETMYREHCEEGGVEMK